MYALAWSPDGRLLASGGLDGGIRLWELSGAQPETFVRMLAGHTNWVLGLAFAPDGTHLASGSWDATVRLWDVEAGKQKACFHPPDTFQNSTDLSSALSFIGHNFVSFVNYSPDGATLASWSADATLIGVPLPQGAPRLPRVRCATLGCGLPLPARHIPC